MKGGKIDAVGQTKAAANAGTRGILFNSRPLVNTMKNAVSEWAKMQKKLAPSKTKANNFNTATVTYDAKTGKYYYGMNRGLDISGEKLNSTLSKMLPEKSLNKFKLGNCAEVDAVNQALNDKANVKDLYLYTIDANTGVPKRMCENCVYTFDGYVKDVITK